jgi:alpha-2,3 sialyltransferase
MNNSEKHTQKSRAVLIAGNGPSLAQIDYQRLPRNIEVWRTNYFFREQKYYCGKTVNKYFIGNTIQTRYGSYFAMQVAASKKEYNMPSIEHYYFGMDVERSLEEEICPPFLPLDIVLMQLVDANINLFEQVTAIRQLLLDRCSIGHPHTGTIMMIMAVMMGYEKLYVTGIDLDYERCCYPWDKHAMQISQIIGIRTYHPHNLQFKYIELLSQIQGVNIYAVSPSSPISKYIELAPIINEYPEGYTPPDKPAGFVNEIVKINMLEPPATPLEVLYESLVKAINEVSKTDSAILATAKGDQIISIANDLKNELAKTNNVDRLRVELSAIASKIDRYLADRRKYPKWLVRLYCCFIPNKQKRKAIRKKYARGCS